MLTTIQLELMGAVYIVIMMLIFAYFSKNIFFSKSFLNDIEDKIDEH